MEISEIVLKFFGRKDVQDALVRNSMETLYELTKDLPDLVIGELTSILIQAGVDPLQGMTEVPAYFLYRQDDIKELNIPDGITKIGSRSFQDTDLKSVMIPDSVEEIESWAFAYCEGLKSIKLPAGVYLDYSALGFTGLESIELEDVKLQGFFIFQNCYQLKSAIIKGNTPEIPLRTFEGCEKLTHVELPASLKEIEQNSFYGCSKLRKINFEGTTTQWKAIEIESPNARLFSCKIICSDGTLRYDKDVREWAAVLR